MSQSRIRKIRLFQYNTALDPLDHFKAKFFPHTALNDCHCRAHLSFTKFLCPISPLFISSIISYTDYYSHRNCVRIEGNKGEERRRGREGITWGEGEEAALPTQ